ncbi:MAG: AI-2E family transporter [Armatimonadota bacterium]
MKQHVQTGIAIALAVVGIVLGLVLIYNLRALLLLALIALVITTGIDPSVQRLQRLGFRGRHMPRALAALLILLAALLVLAGILTFFTFFAVGQTLNFANNEWPGMQERLLLWLQGMADKYPNVMPSTDALMKKLSEQSGAIAGYVWSTTLAVFGVIGGMFSLVTVFILTLFFTIFKDGIVYTLLQFVPPRYQPQVREIGHEASVRMGGWLRGQVLLALIIMGASTIGMSFGLNKYAAMIGIIAGIGELIPLAGPYVGAVPALIIVLATGANPWLILWVLVFFTVLSQVENYLLAPKMMERHVKLSPVTTVFSLLAGGALLGLVGALLAIPLAAAARVVLLAAVFPAIQGKTRREIEHGCPGAPLPAKPRTVKPPAPKPQESAKAPAEPEAVGKKKRGKKAKTPVT